MADITKAVTLPSNGTEVTIRRLNWKQLREAEKVQTQESIEVMKQIGAELIAAFRTESAAAAAEKTAENIEQIQKAERRKPSKYDQEQVLKFGVISVSGQDGQPDVSDLGPLDAESLHEAIVAFCWEGTQAKNASASSIGSSTAIPQ